MMRDKARDRKAEDAKRRANWTMPVEHYWPPEMLALTFPERFEHRPAEPEPVSNKRRSTKGRDRVEMYLPRQPRAEPLRRAAEKVRAERPAPRSYAVERIAGGCHVIRPEFRRRQP